MKKQSSRLGLYNDIRDFESTAEPRGVVKATSSGKSFVVQKHAARRLHYDFRLEHDGVLWSWAVPKGPSLSPKDRRLAVRTEDHPVDYRDFEGTIPHGEYGGGPVIVWDRGEWAPDKNPDEMMRQGHIEFELFGKKLRGKYVLVKTAAMDRGKDNHWLLIKRHDEHVRDGEDADIALAQPASVLTGRTIEDVAEGVPANGKVTSKKKPLPVKLPRFGTVTPQLATLVSAVPTNGDWIYELKYDGYRILAWLDNGAVRLASRTGKEWTEKFPTVVRALARVRATNAIIDGEIAYVDDDGRTVFQGLQNALSSGEGQSRLVYFAFDLLFYDGVDLRDEPLAFRKDKLRTLFAGEKPPLKMADHISGSGDEFFRQACALGLEGIIAKRADRPYLASRTKEWVKVKCLQRQEMIIVGFTLPKASREGIGALLLGIYEGKSIHYAGKVGTGFTQASLRDLAKRLEPLVKEAPSVVGAPRTTAAHWVEPKLVCEVAFTEWTEDGVLRHPSFQGLREDKTPAAVRRERAADTGTTSERTKGPMASKKGPKQAVKATTASNAREATKQSPIRSIKVTNPDRIIDIEHGITKGELVRYYDAVASRLLPFAKNRPLMLLRCTADISKKSACFVQKHAGSGLPADLGTGTVSDEPVVYIDNEKQIVELGQFNCVEIHGWGSRMPKPEQPDWMVFDLDPDESLPFEKVIDAALSLREELSKLELESWVKTTGGKGLHVVVPLVPRDGWEIIRPFSELVANGMVKLAPRDFVATMTKAKRRGKIFVDFFRNGRGATAVLPYSPRARPGITVAVPVDWTDLRHVDPNGFTIRTVPDWISKQRVDPWAKMLTTKQKLSRRILEAVES